MNRDRLSIFAALMLAPIAAFAQAIRSDPARPFSSAAVAVKVGTAGAGFDLATPLARRLNLRGGASFFSYGTSLTEDGLTVSGDIKLQNASVMFDVFPFNNFFRISGGMTVYNNTGLNALLTVPVGKSFDVGNSTYTSSPTDPIHGSANFNFGGKVAPRVTFGTGNMLPRTRHWNFESELGFQYFSQPTVLYVINGSGCKGGNTTQCGPVSQTDVQQEQSDLQNDLSGLRFFPIFSLGVSYKFGSR